MAFDHGDGDDVRERRGREAHAWYGEDWHNANAERYRSEQEALALEKAARAAKLEAQGGVGLVLGRFRPPHKGHVFLVEEARARCAEVYVVSPRPRADPFGMHALAFPRVFGRYGRLLLVDADKVATIASTAELVGHFDPRPTRIFSSDGNVDGAAAQLANALGAQHVVVDAERARFPYQAREIRAAPWERFHWIAPDAREVFAVRVAIVGPEGAGKTTLARELSTIFDAPLVEDQLLVRAREHGGIPPESAFNEEIWRSRARFSAAAQGCERGVIVDDNSALSMLAWTERLRMTASTSSHDVVKQELQERDLWLLCHDDFPWQGPPERNEPAARRAFLDELRGKLTGRRVVEVHGEGQQRVAIAEDAVRRALDDKQAEIARLG